MRFGFVTCVQLGLSCIKKIYEIGGHLDLLISLHDHKAIKKSGRIFLDEFAGENNIPLLKINHINDLETIEIIKEYDLDWLFIIGWSQIASDGVLGVAKNGVLGMHPTLLPQGRGRAAIPWAIIKGLEKTGVSMFKLDSGVDTGDIVSQIEIPILKDETAFTLYEKVNIAHEQLIASTYPLLENNSLQLSKQDNRIATVWDGRTPKDGLLDSAMSVFDAEKLIRATTKPYPGAFLIENGRKRVIWRAKIVNEIGDYDNYLKFTDGYLLILEDEIFFMEDESKH